MVDDPNQVLVLLQICDLSNQWPDLMPIHDRAMDRLRKMAAAHAESEPKKPEATPMRRVSSDA